MLFTFVQRASLLVVTSVAALACARPDPAASTAPSAAQALATYYVGTTATTSFTDTGLSAATKYAYTVKAVDGAGNVSAASSAVTATTQQGSGATGTAKVRYQNNDSAPSDSQIKPGLQLVNTGSAALDLSTVTLRYWFTGDGGATSFTTNVDYAALGSANITQQVVALPSARPGADHYLQVGFGSFGRTRRGVPGRAGRRLG